MNSNIDQSLETYHNGLVKRKELLNEKKKNLETELKNNSTKYDDNYHRLIKINNEIDELNEKLYKVINENDELNAKKDNALINSDNIKKICSECFEDFFIDSIQSLKVLEFEIRFGNTIIFKQITNAGMTFKDLKKETKSQFDRDMNEFFFIDEKSRIYLDEMNIKKALYPLERIAIKNSIPIIYIKDLFISEDQNNLNKAPQIFDKDALGNYNIKSKIELSVIDKIMINLQSYKFTYVNIIIFTLFVIFWVISCIEFRSLKSFFLISSTFDKNLLNPGSSNVYL